MIRSRAPLVLAALALAAGVSACGGSSDTATQEIKTPAPAASLTQDRRETIFLDATAAHLCSVQSQVYTDPSAMASAYASRPIYTDLTDGQVDDFQRRLTGEPAFADRLTQRIQSTCGTPK
ncbi:hypothetical protein ABT297_15335 [Dactylosporangium sp. NPDC000555]|uniref:hypothetical protein n=1 Tax=Dactylosporangium sp. NPDC000555 TaxID=3154260 RepID=UPI0033196F60